jgi:hypothetical protein
VSPALLAWLSAFCFTQAVELPVYAWRLRGGSIRRRLLLGFVATSLTHPVVWFLLPLWLPGPYALQVALSEAFAVGAEAAYLRWAGARRTLSAALLANLASAGLGLLSRAAFGWP